MSEDDGRLCKDDLNNGKEECCSSGAEDNGQSLNENNNCKVSLKQKNKNTKTIVKQSHFASSASHNNDIISQNESEFDVSEQSQEFKSNTIASDSMSSNTSSIDKIQSKNATDSENTSVSSDDTCPICLGIVTDGCVAESCLHRFCFECLKLWARIKNNCPLCKNKFTKILHDIKNDNDYKEFMVPFPDTEGPFVFPAVIVPQFVITPVDLPFCPLNRRDHSIDQRRRIYRDDWWVRFPRSLCNPIRMCSPALYREREGLTHRLIPWIRRELKALKAADHVLQLILDYLPVHRIMSRGFRSGLRPILRQNTEHFQHELNCFAHAPYDMIGYDDATANSYGPYEDRIEPPHAINIDDEDHDNINRAFSNPDEPIEIDDNEHLGSTSENHIEIDLTEDSGKVNSNNASPLDLSDHSAVEELTRRYKYKSPYNNKRSLKCKRWITLHELGKPSSHITLSSDSDSEQSSSTSSLSNTTSSLSSHKQSDTNRTTERILVGKHSAKLTVKQKIEKALGSHKQSDTNRTTGRILVGKHSANLTAKKKVENVVILSSDDETENLVTPSKKIKLNRGSHFSSGGNNSSSSRNREPKDHPSKIKSSKKNKCQSKSRQHS